jgi:rhodanese-related sulfurtransferase
MSFLKQLFGVGTANISAVEAHARIKNEGKTLFLLDVRQPEEYKQGHIAGSKLIPLGELGNRLKEIPQDKEILCICRSGSRSGMAASQLTSAGYKVINLSGGMMAWSAAGLPMKK